MKSHSPRITRPYLRKQNQKIKNIKSEAIISLPLIISTPTPPSAKKITSNPRPRATSFNPKTMQDKKPLNAQDHKEHDNKNLSELKNKRNDAISSQKVDMIHENEFDIKLGQKIKMIYNESNDIDKIVNDVKKAKEFTSSMKQEFMPENDNIDDLIEYVKRRIFENDKNLQKNEDLKEQLKEAQNQVSNLNDENSKQKLIIEQKEKEINELKKALQNQTNKINDTDSEQQTTAEQKEKENNNDQAKKEQITETEEKQSTQSINSESEKTKSTNRVSFANIDTPNSTESSDETQQNLLSNYELGDLISQGNFGKVYKVKDKKTDKIYTAKILKKSVVDDKQALLNLRREVEILFGLKHPAILKFVCYSPVDFKNKPKPVIITEFAENRSLYDLIEMERESHAHKDWNDTTKFIILYGIATAMSFLHSQKIVHRDLKPSNILLDSHLHPKLADFGLSKIIHKNKQSMTTQSIVGQKGTYVYMAPEIWNEKPVYSEASDVYAFGMIMYEVLTNEQPFNDLTSNQSDETPLITTLANKIQSGERPSFKYEILEPLQYLIKSCWDQDPTKRPSFMNIMEQLENDQELRNFDLFDEDEYQNYIDFIQDYNDQIKFIKTPGFDISKYIVSKEDNFKTITIDYNAKIVDKNVNVITNDEIKEKPRKFLCSNEYYDQLDDERKRLIERAENDLMGQYIVGKFLVEGIEGFPQNTIVGIQYLDKAINSGSIEACNYYCNLLIKGQFVEYNLELAEKYLKPHFKPYLKPNSKKGNATTCLLYGRVLRKFEKFDDAKYYFKKGARKGNNEAMYELGKMLYRGEGCEKDEKGAEAFFELAQKNGNYKAYEFVYKQQKRDEIEKMRRQNNNKIDEK